MDQVLKCLTAFFCHSLFITGHSSSPTGTGTASNLAKSFCINLRSSFSISLRFYIDSNQISSRANSLEEAHETLHGGTHTPDVKLEVCVLVHLTKRDECQYNEEINMVNG